MDVEIQPASVQDKSVLRHLMELCQHDYSEFNGEDVNEHGLFGYKYLDHYWAEPGRHPFLIRVSGKLAGFALVRAITLADGQSAHSMAEFFVLRKFRRKGAGRTAAQRIFDMFPGLWRVQQEAANSPAQAFWRATITRYTGGQFRGIREVAWGGPTQEFSAPGQP